MKLIDSGKILKTLDDIPIVTSQTDATPVTIGKSIATILISHKGRTNDPVKLLELARRFHSGKFRVELDASDYETVKEIVRTEEGFTPLVTGQVLEVLLDAKDSKDIAEKQPIELRKKEA